LCGEGGFCGVDDGGGDDGRGGGCGGRGDSNERATTTTINTITNTNTPDNPINQVNKYFFSMAPITTTPITAPPQYFTITTISLQPKQY
jgi:hypothetical protein